MEQKAISKPNIEVIDSRTGNACKVACMSCIRGHRTTSCGKNACRTKLFWTVKRPGRPTTACTCPLGSTGRCQCVIAAAPCPHRPKKGESRSVDCRCDEQGRWCCILEPDHWKALTRKESPRVDFYPNPEAMHAARMANSSLPPTPSFSAGTPQSMNSLPNTPGPALSSTHPANMDMSPFNNYQPPSLQTPRFGLMGIGSPMGSEGHLGEDVLKWQGQSPQAPREMQGFSAFNSPDLAMNLNPGPPGSMPPTDYHYIDGGAPQYPNLEFDPITQSLQDMTMQTQQQVPPLPPALPEFRDNFMEEYYNYQFPSAICQNCGLHGCNCRSCPAVMQSSLDGSWAQCCSRKHVRTAELAQRGIVHPDSLALGHQDLQQFPPPVDSFTGGIQNDGMGGLRPGADPTFSPNFSMEEFGMPSTTGQVDFSEFVMTDPDLPSHGCCCGGET